MKTTERFEKAVTKLYKAFHKGDLNSFDCHSCAVGTMCSGYSKWGFSKERKKIGDIRDIKCAELTNYSLIQLGNIEEIFVNNVPSQYSEDKEYQFKGLCAVVEYLCELDGIPNIMDYSSLFQFDEKGAKKELKEVF